MTEFDDSMVSVRYIVDDVRAAIDFYSTHLGFTLRTRAPTRLRRRHPRPIRLLLSGSGMAPAPAPHPRMPQLPDATASISPSTISMPRSSDCRAAGPLVPQRRRRRARRTPDPARRPRRQPHRTVPRPQHRADKTQHALRVGDSRLFEGIRALPLTGCVENAFAPVYGTGCLRDRQGAHRAARRAGRSQTRCAVSARLAFGAIGEGVVRVLNDSVN